MMMIGGANTGSHQEPERPRLDAVPVGLNAKPIRHLIIKCDNVTYARGMRLSLPLQGSLSTK